MCQSSLVHSDDPNHASRLIPTLCADFYKLGWVTGTGGGISIRQSAPAAPDQPAPRDLIYIAPSGVQKERIEPDDLFVLEVSKSDSATAGAATGQGHSQGAERKQPARAGSLPYSAGGVTIDYVRKPDGLKPSACTPLFLAAFERRGAAACIHTHSQWAVLVTLMVERDMQVLSGRRPATGALSLSSSASAPPPPPPVVRPDLVDSSAKRWDSTPGPAAVLARPFQIARLEQIKGIPCSQFSTTWSSPAPDHACGTSSRKLPHHSFYSTLTIPVIENTAHEEDLAASLTAAMDAYPDSCAVLVMRHGVYVWGETWAAAKTRAESLDYIFQLAVEMRRDGFPWV